MPVTIPATGSGTATPVVSTDNVTADSSQVQNVQLVSVSGGVMTRVQVAADGDLVAEQYSTTGTQSNVASAAADTLILVANVNREVATVYNDSTAVLYLILSTTAASTTVFTVKVSPGGYYETPGGYTGQIRGYWASANGYARVTELT
jgi:hypothetical protein